MIKRRRLGRTGLEVTELGYGAMNLRLLKTFDDAYKIVNYVLDSGINFIDTARAYSGTLGSGELLESEKVLREVISARTDLKEPLVIVTKGHGYTLDELEKDLELSRNALGITGKGNLKIGNNDIKLVYFLHGLSTERWEIIRSSGVLDRLAELKEEGMINFAGFSSHYPFVKEVKLAADTGYFDVVELPYNVFNRTFSEETENMFEYLYKKDIGIINMKAFDGNGMVALYPMIKDFVSITYGGMLDYCLSNPYISTVDAGAKFIEEFQADIDIAMKPRLSDGEKKSMETEADKISKKMKKVCRQCMHCLEKFSCPNNVNFVESLAAYSKYLLATSLDMDSSKFTEDYKNINMRGKDCIECGLCLPWCEYKLNIPEMLKSAEELMK